MTAAIGKGSCSPCCNDWKLKIKKLWENYQEIVTSIRAGNVSYYPDGQGQISLPGILSDVYLYNMMSYFTLVIDTDLSTMNLEDKTSYWTLTIQT